MNPNPYRSPAIPSTKFPTTISHWRILTNTTLTLSGALALLLRELAVRSMYWNKPITITDGSDRELLLHAFLTDPTWNSLQTQAAIIIAPAFLVLLLWTRRHFT